MLFVRKSLQYFRIETLFHGLYFGIIHNCYERIDSHNGKEYVLIRKNLLGLMIAAGTVFSMASPALADTIDEVLVFEASSDAVSEEEKSEEVESVEEDETSVNTITLTKDGSEAVSASSLLFIDAIEADEIRITEESDESGTSFHVFSSDGTDVATTQETVVKTTASSGSKAAELVAYASQFIGNPYRYGGVSLTNGADCSGFMMTVYGHFGIELPHSSQAMAGVGTAVSSLDQALPGDILVYSGHVGIYLGDGKMLSALNSKRGIAVESATYKSIKAIRRVLDTSVSV